jgi:hypothetical protein
MFSRVTLAFAFLLLGLTGCATKPVTSPRELFLRGVADRSAYAKLYEVSPEILRTKEDEVLRVANSIIQGVRKANGASDRNAAIEEGLLRMEQFVQRTHDERMALVRKLELSYDPKTDLVFFFHYWPSDDKQEIGYIVVRDGVLRTKVLLW